MNGYMSTIVGELVKPMGFSRDIMYLMIVVSGRYIVGEYEFRTLALQTGMF